MIKTIARLLRHRWLDEADARRAVPPALAERLRQRVAASERRNNGVLIYLLLAEHAIELVADRGVSRLVPPAAWQAMARQLGGALREGRFEDGLTQALEEVSAVLVAHFPEAEDAPLRPLNQLPDEPVLR